MATTNPHKTNQQKPQKNGDTTMTTQKEIDRQATAAYAVLEKHLSKEFYRQIEKEIWGTTT